MSWFTKEERIPDLPDSDELPRLPDIVIPKKDDEFVQSLSNNLPALPEPKVSPVHNDMQKSRFDIPSEKSATMIPETRAINPQPIMPTFEPVTEHKIPQKISASMAPSRFETKRSKTTEPIYVRLDKFQETQDSIREIKEKLEDIEKNLSKIKDIKDREEVELNEWEREAQLIKSKLNAIDANLFSNL